MEEAPSPVPSGTSEELKTQKKGMLYDIYRKEADSFMSEQRYRKALKSFNLAIQLQPDQKQALIGRSRCYLYLGKTFRAMQDAEHVLSIDASDIDAIYQKAEILFLTSNYQLAVVYYKKGQKLDPDNPYFDQGVRRATDALNTYGGGMLAKNKLSAVGDLSFFSTAGSEESKVGEMGGLRGLEGGGGSALRQPDEDTMKKILRELYGDRQYLQRLQTELPPGRGRTRRDVKRLAEEGSDFLRERSAMWGEDSIRRPETAPLPPPPTSRPMLPYSRYCRLHSVHRL